MKFTKEEISLCKQAAEKHKKEIEYGGWLLNEGGFTKVWPYRHNCKRTDVIPLWTISDCLEFFEKIGLNQAFNFKRFNNGNWSFTAEDNKYRKIRGEGKTRLSACLKAVLAVLEENVTSVTKMLNKEGK